jgi:hypothetical protein
MNEGKILIGLFLALFPILPALFSTVGLAAMSVYGTASSFDINIIGIIIMIGSFLTIVIGICFIGVGFFESGIAKLYSETRTYTRDARGRFTYALPKYCRRSR